MTTIAEGQRVEIDHVGSLDDVVRGQAVCCIEAVGPVPNEMLFYFEYFRKGAANAIFKIRPWSSLSSCTKPFMLIQDVRCGANGHYTGIPLSRQAVMNRVLRVPRGKPKCLSGREIISGFEETIRPLFTFGRTSMSVGSNFVSSIHVKQPQVQVPQVDLAKHLMNHEAVVLFPAVMAHLIAQTESGTLERSESDTTHHPLASERWAMFLPDMSSVPNASITLEIKPKWLLQSPNAPKDALRCRTCAMQIAVPKDRKTYICPLRLVHGASKDIRPWLETNITQLLHHTVEQIPPPSLVSSIVENLLDYLSEGDGQTLLQHLKTLQNELDPLGVLNQSHVYPSDSFDHNLRVAMTLRDCSLFINVPYNVDKVASSQITSRLGDLDFKSAEKIEDWKKKEIFLSKDSLYTKEVDDDLGCWLRQVQQSQTQDTRDRRPNSN